MYSVPMARKKIANTLEVSSILSTGNHLVIPTWWLSVYACSY